MAANPPPAGAGTPRGARFLSWLPALALMGIIFWLSSIPGDRLPMPDFRFSDKLIHFLAYAGLGFLIGQRLPWRRRLAGIPPSDKFPGGASGPLEKARWRGAAIGILYGLGDEVHQLFVPMRLFSLSDFAADALGILAGIVLQKRWGG